MEIVIIVFQVVCSLALTVGLIVWNDRQAAIENRTNKIIDLGYNGYLEHKRLMKSVGIDVD